MGKQRPVLAAVMAAVGIAGVYRYWVRPWMYTWGASDAEFAARLVGDEMVAPSVAQTTRAVTIDAPLHDVWPWLAQIGEDRGGFYSYSWLERAVGANVHNAHTIHPEWQHVGLGQTIWLARRYGEAARQVVADVEPESHLILVASEDFDRLQRGEKASGAWAFYMSRTDGWTRLLVRGSGGVAGKPWFDIPHFAMERKMMRGIRARAEQLRRDETASHATSATAPSVSVSD